MNHRIWISLASVICFQMCFWGNTFAEKERDYSGEYKGSEIFVMVELSGGFGGIHRIAAFGCDGRFVMVGAYSDTTKIRHSVSPEIALGLVNELLAVDFFGQPPVYRAVKGEGRFNSDGRVILGHTEVIDASSFRISLSLGPNSHTVSLVGPAYGAPEALRDWRERFRQLVKEQVDWVNF